jgi:quinol monooxygenase YgiN
MAGYELGVFDMICLAATYRFPEDRLADVKAFLPELISASRREPGCRMYLVHRGIDDPRVFFFYEQYDDDAAVEAHRASEHFSTYVLNGTRKLAEHREIVVLTPFP